MAGPVLSDVIVDVLMVGNPWAWIGLSKVLMMLVDGYGKVGSWTQHSDGSRAMNLEIRCGTAADPPNGWVLSRLG